jgi:hypothetical protein
MKLIQKFRENANLIQKFQKELEVSKNNAILRVTLLVFLCICFFATIALAAFYFPYAGSYAEKVDLLSGSHVQVKEILGGDVLVDKPQFLQIAQGNGSFIALGENDIVYMAKALDISYRCEQVVPERYGYFVSSQHIEDGRAVREMARDTGATVKNIVLPGIMLICLFGCMVFVQTRHVSGYCSTAAYKSVWV